MRYVAAALLSSLAGDDVSADNIKKILDSVGVECENDKMSVVVAKLKGKTVEEVLAAGRMQLASMPAGGGAAPAAGGGGGSAAAAAAPAEEKKEEKKEESEEEEDDDMGFGLFD